MFSKNYLYDMRLNTEKKDRSEMQLYWIIISYSTCYSTKWFWISKGIRYNKRGFREVSIIIKRIAIKNYQDAD